MSQPLYRITFQGKLLYGFEQNEVRDNLAKLTKFDEKSLDRLFSGDVVTLKKDLDSLTAQRYKEVLDKTGAHCDMILQQEDGSSDQASQLPPEETGITCPKCGAAQQFGDSCSRCGILFSKYRQRQQRINEGLPPAQDTQPAQISYFDHHQEQLFILKAFGVILAIILLQAFLSRFIGLFLLFFPVIFLVYIRFKAASEDRSPTEVLAEHITLMPVMYTAEERKKEHVAWVTYSLILFNLFMFYGFEMNTDPLFMANNLMFLPLQPTVLNVPISLFSSMFLHANNQHLWGNMLFLWAVGTVVEKRIGPKRFITFYLLTGIAANLCFLIVHGIIIGGPAHIIGASGAIAGIMGLYAVRCYFKSMVFPLPILGIFSLFLPISLKVRLNALVLIGLFFLADLSGGIGQITGHASMVGHWAHIGGMLCGIGLAMAFKLSQQAFEERHLEIGSNSVHKQSPGMSLESGEESLNLILKENPENVEALLLLAQIKTKFRATPEGEQLYTRALGLLLKENRLPEAATTFVEFHRLYLKGIDGRSLYRLANYFNQQNELEHVATCLELLCNDPQTSGDLLEKSLYQYGKVLESLGMEDAAEHYFCRILDQFPNSPFSQKLQLQQQRG